MSSAHSSSLSADNNIFTYIAVTIICAPTAVSRLTVLVAWLSKGLSLGENDSHSQILEGGDVEEGGVLVVPYVFVVLRIRDV